MTDDVLDKYASSEEAAVALEQLKNADMIRLEKIARNRVRGLRHIDWEDLLQETLRRVLGGNRQWPRHVPIITFMAWVMKSIANEHWEKQHRTTEAGVFLEADTQPQRELEAAGVIETAPSHSDGIEQELEAKQELEAIECLFADDDYAFAIVMCRAEGYSPAEIQEEFEMTSTQYASSLKKIRRRLLKYKNERTEQ